MTQAASEEIIRIAAKGDGVTASGRFAWGAAPGDLLLADGTIQPGPHHVAPACRHFGQCGGCQLQQLDEESLAQFVESRVTNASASQELGAGLVAHPHLSPPGARRRVSLRAESSGGRIVIGFREAKSHRLVELAECPVMLDQFVELLSPLRKLLIRLGQGGGQAKGRNRKPGGRNAMPRMAVDVELAMSEQGIDLGIKGLVVEGLEANQSILDFAQAHRLARFTLDQGYGPETLWEPEPVTVALSGVSVPYPPGAFLQATLDGEQALVGAARRLLRQGLCDAVLVGGVDTLCQLTLNGFAALESLSPELCQPMSRNRQGINIGEGAALLLMTREDNNASDGSPALLGAGESSDAYHISAPHPQGLGAETAMRAALADAGLVPADVDYLNLHATATRKNDEMESRAVARLFPDGVAASGTKPLTGHTLGCAGATELALCWLALRDGRLPPHVWDGEADAELPQLALVAAGSRFGRSSRRVCLSNSFAFGGSNACLLIGDAR